MQMSHSAYVIRCNIPPAVRGRCGDLQTGADAGQVLVTKESHLRPCPRTYQHPLTTNRTGVYLLIRYLLICRNTKYFPELEENKDNNGTLITSTTNICKCVHTEFRTGIINQNFQGSENYMIHTSSASFKKSVKLAT